MILAFHDNPLEPKITKCDDSLKYYTDFYLINIFLRKFEQIREQLRHHILGQGILTKNKPTSAIWAKTLNSTNENLIVAKVQPF